MKFLFKNIIAFLFTLLAFNSYSQQNAVMTHYTINPYLYNPAQVGENGFTSFQAHYRKQWVKMPDSPDTKLLAFQSMVNNKYGLGGKIYIDKANIIQNFGALFSYAYYIRAKKNPSKHYLSLGLSAGIKSQRLWFNEANIKDDFDPSIFYDGATNTVFDAEVGINYRLKGFRLAAFVSNLAPHSYNYKRDDSFLEFKPSYHIYGNVGYDILIGSKKKFAIKPSVLVRYIPDVPFQFDGNLLLDWNETIWIGGGYRYKNAGMWATAGFRVHKAVAVTYSYEQSIDGFQAALGTTHEMTIEFRFQKKNKNLEKDLDKRFQDMKSKMIAKNKDLLDSLNIVKDDMEKLENSLKDSIEKYYENNLVKTDTVYKGSKVKYAMLGKVNYYLNSATIHNVQEVEAKAIFDLVDKINKEGNLILIRIEGSASIEGSETYNLLLSNKRNESMKEYLIKKGIDGNLITTESKGDSEPMMRDDSYEDPDNAIPNPEDRYVKVYILFNE